MRREDRTTPEELRLARTAARRRLLVATVGLAAVSTIGAGCTSGNLMSPDTGAGDSIVWRPPDAPSDDTETR